MKNIKILKLLIIYLKSILLFENKNILISSGNGIKFWDLNNENETIKKNHLIILIYNGIMI